MQVNAEFPAKLRFLFRPHRYKIAWGGRGSAKSWSYARALLIQGAQQPLRIPCCRETQKSISESVHALLEDQIGNLGLRDFYRVEKARIVGVNQTEFTFHGLRHDPGAFKSLEGADRCWIEEAQGVSKKSWETLIPTVRKAGSEIWATWNPDFATDETYQRFVVHPPANAVVVKVNYSDNPWFPAVLREEMEELKAKDLDAYNHVWEGCCVNVLEGAIYADELRACDREGRITRIPYDSRVPVHTFWDLGWGDLTSIWFIQFFPYEYRVLEFLQGARRKIADYIRDLQERPYVYGTHYLPHDARAHELGSGKSIEERMREATANGTLRGSVQIVPQIGVAAGIDATREAFGQCYFDRERCEEGIQALRRYRYGEIKQLDGAPTREPLHDEFSHAADAYRMFGVMAKPPTPKHVYKPPKLAPSGGWMG